MSEPLPGPLPYNNQVAVPEHYRHAELWRDTSAFVRRHMACAADLAYGDHPRERLDIFPAAVPGAPVLMFIHGGWFQFLDKSSLSFVAAPYVQAGITVVAIGYPLAPDAGLPAIIESAGRALLWVHGHIGDHGGDPERIFVAGHSAGGHLALCLGLADWGARAGLPGLVKGCFPISGLYDMRPVLDTIYNAKLGLDPETAAACSPLLQAEAAPARLIVSIGGDEIAGFHWQHRALLAFCTARGIAVEDHIAPGRNHYSVVEEFCTASGALFGKVRAAILAG